MWGLTDVRSSNKYKTLRRYEDDRHGPENLSEPQFVLPLPVVHTSNELILLVAMSSLSSSKDFNVAIVGGGMCGLAW